MQITLNLPDGLVAKLLAEAGSCEMSFEEYVQTTLIADINKYATAFNAHQLAMQAAKATSFSLHAMLRDAQRLTVDRPMIVEDLYAVSHEQNWNSIPPSERKRIGREFAEEVRRVWEMTILGARGIQRVGRTLQNKALYAVREKGEPPADGDEA